MRPNLFSCACPVWSSPARSAAWCEDARQGDPAGYELSADYVPTHMSGPCRRRVAQFLAGARVRGVHSPNRQHGPPLAFGSCSRRSSPPDSSRWARPNPDRSARELGGLRQDTGAL